MLSRVVEFTRHCQPAPSGFLCWIAADVLSHSRASKRSEKTTTPSCGHIPCHAARLRQVLVIDGSSGSRSEVAYSLSAGKGFAGFADVVRGEEFAAHRLDSFLDSRDEKIVITVDL